MIIVILEINIQSTVNFLTEFVLQEAFVKLFFSRPNQLMDFCSRMLLEETPLTFYSFLSNEKRKSECHVLRNK